ncbi:DEAD/DEAH box helicase [Streptomyces sp. NPDC001902]
MTTQHVITVPPRPHQTAATDSAAQALTIHPGHAVPPQGLRTQARLATGSGKTLIGQMTAHQVGARRVIILGPSLDLLEQTADAWRRSGHHGPMFGLCSLTSTPGLRCTINPAELIVWTADLPDAAVFATYASVGLGTLQEAHTLGLPEWDLAILDEAHRVSGAIGKPWAAVLDNTRIPATRRLSLTATPRMWELGGSGDRDTLDDGDAPSIGGSGRSAVKLIVSMDDPSQFGEVAYELPLRTAIDEGIIAPYRVVCVEIADPAYQAAVAAGRSRDRIHSLRLAAMQAAMLKTASDYRLERVLTFTAGSPKRRPSPKDCPRHTRTSRPPTRHCSCRNPWSPAGCTGSTPRKSAVKGWRTSTPASPMLAPPSPCRRCLRRKTSVSASTPGPMP